nr:hypothetical protein [Tanacetum cinerariifolium]
ESSWIEVSGVSFRALEIETEFWATATVHHHSIRFKMDIKKCIVNLEYFREMLHICPRLPGHTFDELPFEEEILAFLRFLRNSGEIRKLIDEEFVYQVEHKDAKKSNEIYYPRDDQMFTTIKLVSRHQNTQQFGVMLLVELTNEDIRNSEAYKEYYVVASGAAPPKTKASLAESCFKHDQDAEKLLQKVDHQQYLFQTLDVGALLNLELSVLAPLLSDPTEGSSSLSSSSRRLFNVTVSSYVSKMILLDS